MTKTETSILGSKTPEDYIDRSLKARLTPAAKAKLARRWMEATGYTKEDILRARNRHPYWKRKKMEGSAERTRKRLAAHDYSGGASVRWDQALVTEFLGLNRKGPDGRYEQKDWQLAERFGATIPSIQYMRRKLSRVESLLGSRAAQSKVVEYLLRAESVLSRGKAAVEELKLSRKAPAAKGPRRAAVGKASARKPKAAAKAKPAAKPRAVAKPKAKQRVQKAARISSAKKPSGAPKSSAGRAKAASAQKVAPRAVGATRLTAGRLPATAKPKRK